MRVEGRHARRPGPDPDEGGGFEGLGFKGVGFAETEVDGVGFDEVVLDGVIDRSTGEEGIGDDGTATEEPPPPQESTRTERFLRPYAIDAGSLERPAPPGAEPVELDLLTLVMAARTPGRREWLRPEREAILKHAFRARTIAELASEIGLPIGQVRAMVGEMVSEGALQRCGPSRPLERQDILHAVLVGLRSL